QRRPLPCQMDDRTLAVPDSVAGPKTKDVTRIQLWDWDAGRVIRTFQGPASEGCCRLEFSPDGGHLVATFEIRGPRGESRYRVQCWDVADGRQTLEIQARVAAVTPTRLWACDFDSATLQSSLQAWDYTGALVEQLDLIGSLSP